ncbi:MAG: two pore domain potassium channel family protein [Bacteroidales bacterium]|nr:two pore domain potassium channel family protein [Bacteroidales bacterium]
MISHFSSFKVKISPSPFTTKKGLEFENTACISFLDENKKEIAYLELAYIDEEYIFSLISEKKSIILDEGYIENFSLSSYRKKNKLSEEELVELIDFSAKDAVFDSKNETDFTFANFSGNSFSFKGTMFINGSVSFLSSKFPAGKQDFTYIHFFNGEVNFANTHFGEGNVDFKNTVFKAGTKDFQYAEFGLCSVSFVNTDFGDGDVNFINTNFGDGDVSFKVARFGTGKVDFHFSRFGNGDISFERTEFGDGRVDFRKVEFSNGKVNFNRAIFGDGDVSFEESELLDNRMTFKKTSFGFGNIVFEEVDYKTSEVLFDDTLFAKGNVYFGKSKFKKLSLISCHLNHYYDFRVSFCEQLDLSDTIVRDIVDFTPYDYDVEIKCLNLTGMRLIGQIYIDWHGNNVKEIITKQENTSNAEKANQFRVLKENYGRIGNYKYEDLAYIQFKRHEQKADFSKALNNNKFSALWQYPLFGFRSVVIDRMGLYATSPARVFTSLIMVYVFFSLLHLILPFFMDTAINCITDDKSFLFKILDTFYYSLITFTTVGYGDCSPVGFLRLVASVEGFLGPFMMSYFTVAFARKILR